MLGIRDDRGGHADAHQNYLALRWLIISPACLQMLWPCSVKCMFHSLSGLPLICVALFFLFFFFAFCGGGGLLDGFAFTSPSWLNNHLIHASQTSPYWLLTSLRLFIRRPSTKTTWFWRKEISTSTHSSPGRPIPMHTSPTSTPMMTINPCHSGDTYLIILFDCIPFVLCIEIRDTMSGVVPLRDSMAAGM